MPSCTSARLWAAASLALAAACQSGTGAPGAPGADRVAAPFGARYVERAAEAGLVFHHVSGSPEQRYVLESMSGGAAFFDADGDEDLDLFLVNSARIPGPVPGVSNHLFESVPAADGSRAFCDVTSRAGLERGGWGMGCAVGDTDNDGDVDLYVTYWGPNALYENTGDGRFVDITAAAGVGDAGWGTSAAFGDLDDDGLLDLFVANYLEFDLDDPPGGGLPCSGWRGLDVYCGPHGMQPQANVLYRNEGGNRFADRSRDTGVAADLQPSLGVVFGDFDDDGDQDLYVANDGYPNLLYRNDGDWRLTEVGALVGAAYSEDGRSQAGMGVAVGDYDADGDFDLIVTHFSDDVNTLYQNVGDGRFRDATAAAGLTEVVRPFLGWGTGFIDVDNDGWLDLFVANGHIYPQVDVHPSGYRYAQRNLLFRNLGGRFEEVGIAAGLGREAVSRGAAFADYDDDGDLDMVVTNLNDTLDLLHNVGGAGHHWLGLRLVGRRSNRDAIGARARLYAGGRVQTLQVQRAVGYLSQSDPRLLFGLGEETRVDSVVVRWSGRREQVLRALAADRYHVVEEGTAQALAAYSRPDPLQASSPAAAVEAPPATPSGEPAYTPAAGWTTQQHYEHAAGLYAQGRFEEALAAFRWIAAHEPTYLPARYSLAVTLFSGMGRVAEAGLVLEEAVRADSTREELFRLLGVVYLNLHEPGKAAVALERAVALSPTSWEDHSWLGLAYLRLGDLAPAERAFQEAARRAPWKPQPHLHLADLYDRRGQPELAAEQRRQFERLRPAEDAVDRALRQVQEFPGDPQVRYRLGLACLAQSRYDDAAESFQAALAIDPGLAAAHHGLGAAHHMRHQLPEAIAAYQRACQLDPARLAAHADLAQALLEARRFVDAVAALDRALALDPKQVALRSRRGWAAAAAGRIDEGLRDLEAVLDAEPDRVDNRQALAEVYAAAGRLEDSERQWREVLRLEPGHPVATARLEQLRRGAASR